ncbi:hypothetical protein CL622_08060 [archaeon]|nr:hypothetical protein [archaeon]|tara:strand:+ start:675 stop:1304 length:630 start_codon:yes stop_codon:yes gene_type:complete
MARKEILLLSVFVVSLLVLGGCGQSAQNEATQEQAQEVFDKANNIIDKGVDDLSDGETATDRLDTLTKDNCFDVVTEAQIPKNLGTLSQSSYVPVTSVSISEKSVVPIYGHGVGYSDDDGEVSVLFYRLTSQEDVDASKADIVKQLTEGGIDFNVKTIKDIEYMSYETQGISVWQGFGENQITHSASSQDKDLAAIETLVNDFLNTVCQ